MKYCICVFWDEEGIVRDYFIYYLKGLQEIAEKILVVANGKLTEESRNKLKVLGIDILQRENKGLDFGAWKIALEQTGYAELSKYDELILTNNTCYGPIYPLSEMFDEMTKRDCDFWGITKHPDFLKVYTIKKDKRTKIIEYVQSYFLVFKQKVFLSDAFKKFWDNVKFYNDYKKIVGFYETKLTKYFEDYGFKSDCYIDFNRTKDYTLNPIFITDMILENFRLPLIKRRLFTAEYNTFIKYGLPYHARAALEFIEKNTDYNTGLIWNDILHTQPLSKTVNNLSLNYVLPTKESVKTKAKTALVMYIYYEDKIPGCLSYAASMPENADIYLISSKQSVLDECKRYNILKNYRLKYILKENRGRDVSAYLISAKEVFLTYDYICCLHDKKSPQAATKLLGHDFQYQCFECLVKNKHYVQNVIKLFEANPFLGLLCPLPVCFGGLSAIYNEIGPNLEPMKHLMKELNLNVPFDYHPPAPFGSMFWIRGKAAEPLFRHNWVYEDFPAEPLPPDGTISHAIERIYPFVAQEAGYYTASCYPDTFVPVYLNVLFNRLKYSTINTLNYNKILRKNCFKQLKYRILSKLFNTEYYKKKYLQTRMKSLTYKGLAERDKLIKC